jgi:hypothetical protein
MGFDTEYSEKRAEKWKCKIHKLIPMLTNGEQVFEAQSKSLDDVVVFYRNLKDNPESQMNNDALRENPKFLEFTCKALQRVMEIGKKTDDELDDIMEAIKLKNDLMETLENSIEKTKNSLASDVVQRRYNRFLLIEAKVKEIQDQTSEINISMVDLDKLLSDIKRELANTEQFSRIEFSEAQIKYFLNVGQFLFLKAMVTSMINRRAFDYQKDTGLPAYQNIVLLDFSDVVTQVNDFKDQMSAERHRIRDELIEKQQRLYESNPPPAGEENKTRIPEVDDIEVPVKSRVSAISRNINLLSKAAQYSTVSKAWVLLENIVKYTWNLISYELASPLELSRTDAYKDIFLITE